MSAFAQLEQFWQNVITSKKHRKGKPTPMLHLVSSAPCWRAEQMNIGVGAPDCAFFAGYVFGSPKTAQLMRHSGPDTAGHLITLMVF